MNAAVERQIGNAIFWLEWCKQHPEYIRFATVAALECIGQAIFFFSE